MSLRLASRSEQAITVHDASEPVAKRLLDHRPVRDHGAAKQIT